MNAPTRTPISRLFYALTILVAASALIIYMANSGPTHVAPRLSFSIDKQTPVDKWLEYERPLALNGIVDNIGPSGSKATGARRGVVIASPSKWNPDYFYTWTRDSALTIAALMDEIVSDLTRELLGTVHDCILAQRSLQRRTNPSGNLTTGGLGEAKFNVDLTAFTGDWGRPQRDGPALRAIAVSKYARHMFSKDSTNTANALIWPDIIEPDLSYVKKNWNVSTFDLWEEVEGFSFFTTAMQYRSLVQGDRLAREIGRDCDECISQAGQVLDFLQTYWNGTNIIANTAGGRSGKDINSILASVHMFEPEHGCDAVTFQPCSDRALANHKVVTDSFRSVYAINKEFPAGVGVAVGRYPEDIYMGGNPWYLGNFAAAEMLYLAVITWKRLGSMNITATSQPFFQDLRPLVEIGTLEATSIDFWLVVLDVLSYADSYLDLARKYTPEDGSLAEQFSRDDGRPLSARDLTWSYVGLLTADKAREAAMSRL